MLAARHLAAVLVLCLVPLMPSEVGATPKIAEQVQTQTLKIIDRNGDYAGYAVAAGEHVWSCAHCYDQGEKGLVAVTFHGCKFPLTMLAHDRDNYDLCAFALPKGVHFVGPAWHSGKPGVGEKVYVVGGPSVGGGRYIMHWNVTAGIISGHDRDIPCTWKNKLDQHDATSWYGNSGGPVFLQETGQLAGIHVGGDHQVPGIRWFVPVRQMREFAAKHKVPCGDSDVCCK